MGKTECQPSYQDIQTHNLFHSIGTELLIPNTQTAEEISESERIKKILAMPYSDSRVSFALRYNAPLLNEPATSMPKSAQLIMANPAIDQLVLVQNLCDDRAVEASLHLADITKRHLRRMSQAIALTTSIARVANSSLRFIMLSQVGEKDCLNDQIDPTIGRVVQILESNNFITFNNQGHLLNPLERRC